MAGCLPLLFTLGLTTNVFAKEDFSFGPAVDAFCQSKNGQTPFSDQGCALCHVGNLGTRVEPEWTWWGGGDFGQFCPDAVNNPPNGVITSPSSDMIITEGEAVLFRGDGSDPDGHLPLRFHWSFDGAAAESDLKEPGEVVFAAAGVHLVRLTVTDSLGLADATPALRRVTVEAAISCTDADNDGFSQEGGACGPVDCNDADGSVNPAATEVCTDGVDNNCNGLTDAEDPTAQGCPGGPDCSDLDGDLFSPQGNICGPVDCDDTDASVNPGAAEACGDGIDNDCDGATDGTDGECDGSDCLSALFGDDAQMKILSASWLEPRAMLRVVGEGVPPGGQVAISNAFSLEPLGTARGREDGRWVFRVQNPDSIPCSVLAEHGQSVDSSDVKDAPDDCDAGNRPPVAYNDRFDAHQGQTLVIGAPGVLSNDTDEDGDPLQAVLLNAPSQGTLNLSADGSFTYQPQTGFSGTDSFTYQAGDGLAFSDAASVELEVAPGSSPSLYVEEAVWESEESKLEVEGGGAAPGSQISILDADSGRNLGTVTAEGNGEFEFETTLSSPPCSIQVRSQGSTSVPVRVENVDCDADA
ncbi:MAG: Ig-like domain-containing protein [Pseudomonadota bacterium]|nr:Ig-like domain-containing protein [Pseudomonadota bacterium]